MASKPYQHLWERSRAELSGGELGRAIHTLAEATQLAPDEVVLWQELYNLCLLADSPSDALNAATELLRLAPQEPRYLYMHGMATLMTGDARSAAARFEEALGHAPDSVELLQALARTMGLLGRAERERELLERAVAAEPTHLEAVKDLAVHYLSTGSAQERIRAQQVLKVALREHPRDAGLRLNLALALADSAPAEALPHAREAMASDDADLREQAERLVRLLDG